MNLELRGKNKCIAEMMSTVSPCKRKFELRDSTFYRFPNMQDHLGKYPNCAFQREKCDRNQLSNISEIDNVASKKSEELQSTCHSH
jgi:hypothetical protein